MSLPLPLHWGTITITLHYIGEPDYNAMGCIKIIFLQLLSSLKVFVGRKLVKRWITRWALFCRQDQNLLFTALNNNIALYCKKDNFNAMAVFVGRISTQVPLPSLCNPSHCNVVIWTQRQTLRRSLWRLQMQLYLKLKPQRYANSYTAFN